MLSFDNNSKNLKHITLLKQYEVSKLYLHSIYFIRYEMQKFELCCL